MTTKRPKHCPITSSKTVNGQINFLFVSEALAGCRDAILTTRMCGGIANTYLVLSLTVGFKILNKPTASSGYSLELVRQLAARCQTSCYSCAILHVFVPYPSSSRVKIHSKANLKSA